jgi:ribosomal protein L30
VSDTIRIEQVASPIRRHHSQRSALIGLGLNKIGRIREARFNAPTWGMIQKVRHLIRFPDQEFFEQHRLVLPQPEDEEADKAVMRQLLFRADDVELVALPEKTTKTPDYKITKNGELKGYWELKSPRDDWIFAFPKDLKPGELREVHREDPTAHALARIIGKAALQFDAVNPDHAQANVLVVMSHARLRGRADLHLAIGGIEMPDGTRRFLLVDPDEKDFEKAFAKQKKLMEDAHKVDLFYWIEAHTKKVSHVVNKDGPRHKEACDLCNIAV